MLKAKVEVDFSKKGAPLKPVHGVCNGPICRNGTMDITDDYIDLGVPFVRLHDTDGCASRFYVDVSRIFTNFDADENDPANYLFHHTDRLLKEIERAGAKVIYRLGESIDHDIYKRYARPPEDFDKWVRICANIIRHYNRGWANGFSMGIERWEIWNEPDCQNADGSLPMWTDGTMQQAFDLYKRSARLKEEFPEIKLGGMAFVGPNENVRRFAEFCKRENLPLDFLSFHLYYNELFQLKEAAAFVKNALDENGFESAEIIFDEWNYFGDSEVDSGALWVAYRTVPAVAKRLLDTMKNEVGASFCAASFIAMNDCAIDIAAYYDAQPTSRFSGLYDECANKQKTYYAFKAYGELYRARKPRVECLADGVYALASECGILAANYKNEAVEVSVSMHNFTEKTTAITTQVLDKSHDLEVASVDITQGKAYTKIFAMPPYSVVLFRL